MKTVQKTFRFIPKLSVVKSIGLSLNNFSLKQCGNLRRELYRLPQSRLRRMRSQPREGHFDGRDGVTPYDFFAAGITIFDTVMVSLFISPVSLTV
jgi:hypothetical protein